MIYPFPPPIPDELLARALRLSPTTLSDGAPDMSLCMDHTIKPLDAAMRFAGAAVTVETGDGDNLPIHVATYSAPGPGYVMVIDGKRNRERAYFGDLIMSAARAVGYAAMVTDGLARDREEAVRLGFPVFAAGLIPRGPTKKRDGVINGPIRCGGIAVNPGDLVVGDADGICVVPRESVADILDNAEKKHAYEVERRAVIAEYRKARLEGKPLPDIKPKWL